MQQTATVLRASPVRHSVVVGPCLLTRRFAWAYLWVFPPPGTQGRSATPHQHLSSPWAPTRLLLPEGQVHTHIQRPLLEPVLAGKVTSHFKTLPLFTAKPVAFCQQRQQILFAGQHYSLQNCPLFTFFGAYICLFNSVSLILYFPAIWLHRICSVFLSPSPATLPP